MLSQILLNMCVFKYTWKQYILKDFGRSVLAAKKHGKTYCQKD
jgi:hypothetical protein